MIVAEWACGTETEMPKLVVVIPPQDNGHAFFMEDPIAGEEVVLKMPLADWQHVSDIIKDGIQHDFLLRMADEMGKAKGDGSNG